MPFTKVYLAKICKKKYVFSAARCHSPPRRSSGVWSLGQLGLWPGQKVNLPWLGMVYTHKHEDDLGTLYCWGLPCYTS